MTTLLASESTPLFEWPQAVAFAVAALAILAIGHIFLIRRSRELGAEKRFPRQLIMVALTVVVLVLMILSLTEPVPEHNDLRKVLFGFFGILFSGVLGISSTTIVSNMMAGLVLRATRSFRSGDFIRVGEEFGRVTERGLFHIEIQTEDRDLITFPNLYVATKPIRVVRSSGTIISVTLSLGYDVARARVEQLLKKAAEEAELQEPYVHIIDLGDYAISYRIAGLLPEVRQLRTARSNLRKLALDRLHEDGIEIVSPSFMIQRPLSPEDKVVPAQTYAAKPTLEDDDDVEAIIFDKADSAEAKEKLQVERERLTVKLGETRKARKACKDEREAAGIEAEIEQGESRLAEIGEELAILEAGKDEE